MVSEEVAEQTFDTGKARASRVIRIAATVAACGFILLVVARIVLHDPGFASTLALGGALSLLAIWLNKKGFVLISGVLLNGVLVCIAGYLMVVSDGTHDASVLTFPGVLVLAALTLPRGTYVVMAALIVLFPPLVGMLEIRHIIVNPFVDHTNLLSVVDLTVILLVTAAAVELMMSTVTESRSRARASEARFRLLFKNSGESIFVFGALGPDNHPAKVIEVSDIACAQLGYAHEEIVRLSPSDIFDPTCRTQMTGVFSGLTIGESAACESAYRTKNGRAFPVELSMQLFDLNGTRAIIINARDITGRKRADDLIRSALREKEVLLREVHHRVKNNMQVISSLLNLQASQTQDEVTRAMLEESRQRVRSIGLIHEKLYNSLNLASIDFGAYLKSVADELLRSFGSGHVACSLDMETIPFEIDKAIPAGLIVNELLTNALRHAFPAGRKGTVWLRLHARGDDGVEMVVQDDGVGIPAGTDVGAATTMGLAIVRTLVEQMHGTLTVDDSHGTAFTIRFPLERKTDPPPSARAN